MIIKDSEDKPEFYIIKEGKVLIYFKSENLAYLSKGEYFGEQSLLYHSTRKASAKALEETVLMMITKDSLFQILGGNLETVLYTNTIKIAFSKDPLFSKFSQSQINKIIEKISIKNIKGVKKRYPTEEVWVVIKGKVEEEGNIYELYSVMNSAALLNTEIFSTETQSEEATIGVLSRRALESVISSGIHRQFEINEVYKNLKDIFIFSLISDLKLERLAALVKEVTVNQGEVIFNENDLGFDFFIVKSGEVQILLNGRELRKLGKNDFFGEKALLFDEPRSASAIALTKCEFWKMTRNTFELVVDSCLRHYLLKKSRLITEKFPISDLSLIRYIGKGSYSKVFLVENKNLDLLYVLKVIEKQIVEKHNLMRRLIEEKTTHYQLNFQFIPTLVNTYKNDKFISFLCEYFPGPSLLSLIRDSGGITLKQVQFYTSVILLTLQYLHSRGVVHRGISPENIIIDSSGYPILVEMHPSKRISDRTFTILGVTHYMSPEMIRGKGYSFSSDFWSLGILVYEMIFTFVPFANGLEDPYYIYQSILEDELKYPVFTKRNMKINGLLDQLLNKTPGNRGTIDSIMKHSWFEGNPWDAILSKRITPDYIHNFQEKHEERQNFSEILKESLNDWAEDF
jgi:cGMP-dependent protein kinase